jgi:uncharacterized protein
MIAAAPAARGAARVRGVRRGRRRRSTAALDGVRALLDRHPDLVLVVAHLGIPQHTEFVPLAEAHADLYLDVAMTMVSDVFDAAVDAAMLERIKALKPQILFGSDYPSIPHDYAHQVAALARLDPTEDELRQLLAGTARRLLAQRLPR